LEPRHRQEDNIKLDLTEIECEVENYIQLAKDRAQGRASVKWWQNFPFLRTREFLDQLNCSKKILYREVNQIVTNYVVCIFYIAPNGKMIMNVELGKCGRKRL
jgi:hypothetical protein